MTVLFVLAVNMVNGMSVNGLGEVSMDTSQTNNLIALGTFMLDVFVNLHPLQVLLNVG